MSLEECAEILILPVYEKITNIECFSPQFICLHWVLVADYYESFRPGNCDEGGAGRTASWDVCFPLCLL